MDRQPAIVPNLHAESIRKSPVGAGRIPLLADATDEEKF